MDYREFMNLLKSYRQQLSFQQFSTLRGQAKAGDIDAAYKGLQKLLPKSFPINEELTWNREPSVLCAGRVS